MSVQLMAVLGAAVFFAVKMGWIKWPPTATTAPVTPTPADKPLTAADVKTLLADHGLECKRKAPEVKVDGDTITIKGLPTK